MPVPNGRFGAARKRRLSSSSSSSDEHEGINYEEWRRDFLACAKEFERKEAKRLWKPGQALSGALKGKLDDIAEGIPYRIFENIRGYLDTRSRYRALGTCALWFVWLGDLAYLDGPRWTQPLARLRALWRMLFHPYNGKMQLG